MKQWFLGLSQRERLMVSAATTVVGVFLLYLLIWQPISNHFQQLAQDVSNDNETLLWMKQAASELRQLRGNDPLANRPQGRQFVLGMIERTAKSGKLGGVMKRVQPEGQNGVRVWFEDAAFDDVLQWLAILDSAHGLLVKEITIEKQQNPGLVNVRVLLES